MVTQRALTGASVLASFVLMAAELLDGEFFWVIVLAINVSLLLLPGRHGLDFAFCRSLVGATLAASLLGMALVVVNQVLDPFDGTVWLEVNAKKYFSAMIQSMMTFADGLMLFTLMDRGGVLTLSKRWTVLYAMMFSLMISVVSLFFTFVYLYEAGYPVFNGDIAFVGYRDSNNMMMTAALVTTFASAAYALFTVRWTRGDGKDVFTEERS